MQGHSKLPRQLNLDATGAFLDKEARAALGHIFHSSLNGNHESIQDIGLLFA